jgi:hypothetical protein
MYAHHSAEQQRRVWLLTILATNTFAFTKSVQAPNQPQVSIEALQLY